MFVMLLLFLWLLKYAVVFVLNFIQFIELL